MLVITSVYDVVQDCDIASLNEPSIIHSFTASYVCHHEVIYLQTVVISTSFPWLSEVANTTRMVGQYFP